MASAAPGSSSTRVPVLNFLFEIIVPAGDVEGLNSFFTPDFTVGQSTFALQFSTTSGIYLVGRVVTTTVSITYRLHSTTSPHSSPSWSSPDISSVFKKNGDGWGGHFEEKWMKIKAGIEAHPLNSVFVGVEIVDHPRLHALVKKSGHMQLLNLPVTPARMDACVSVHPKDGTPYILSSSTSKDAKRRVPRYPSRRTPDFKSRAMSDFTIVTSIDGTELFTHRFMLASASEYFESLLAMPCEEATSGRLIIKDISGDVMRDLLLYMYTGSLEIDLGNVTHVLELWRASDQFLADDLLKELLFVISSKNLGFITPTSCCEVLVTLAPFPRAKSLVDDCITFIANNFVEVTALDSWTNLFIPFAGGEGKELSLKLWKRVGEGMKAGKT
ncbi:Protein CBR-bath-44 [Gonapodya sp. JEL0774]|nr:Protein CBR-bath-44 [Gonapodya sp. JEL0774]